ncbi:hypothetical protein KFE94_09825 [bacterium SCSIO 12643]|nr:hypothetical protein KFE94_09825 [bacterium SCSIO 12643]
MRFITYSFLILFLGACSKSTPKSVDGKWIKGSEQDKIESIERQFRGFDLAMVETGYRYKELFWAGQDQNWEYAQYQVEKIEKTIKNGLERRPKRAKSAEFFLAQILPEMKKSIELQDSTIFNKNFEVLTRNCNACHAMENVAYFTVKQPLDRPSPIRK